MGASTTVSKRTGGGNKHTIDMTAGPILPLIIRFAIPLLLGNLFQQLYNMVDTWVIGQTGVNDAYAAVGSVSPVINILIGFFSGFATGTGVLISQSFGKRDDAAVHRAVHTATALTVILCVAFTALGVGLTPWITSVIFDGEGTSTVTPYAKEYLTVYFAGIAGLLIYNMGSGILRAVGDSRHPFYFLIVAAVINIVGDFVFVFGFGMGVRGVALATILAQAVSAVLVVITLLRIDNAVRLVPKEIRLDLSVLRQIITLGLPAAIQVALTAFANVFVQSYIAGANGDQTFNLSGFTTYSKLDHILFLPLTSLSLAITTFVGQNVGVGDYKRARRGTYLTLLLTFGIIAVLIVLIWIFSPSLAGIFNPDAGVVSVATRLLRTLTPFYIVCPLNQIFAGSLRGYGKSTLPMISMLSCFVGVRQIYLFTVTNYFSNDLMTIVFSYPVGWFSCAITITTMFLVVQMRLDKRSAKAPEILQAIPDEPSDTQAEQSKQI